MCLFIIYLCNIVGMAPEGTDMGSREALISSKYKAVPINAPAGQSDRWEPDGGCLH